MDRGEGDFEVERLRAHMAGIAETIDGPWAEVLRRQLHLDRDRAECAYWHAGYYQAMADLIDVLSARGPTFDSAGISSPIQLAC